MVIAVFICVLAIMAVGTYAFFVDVETEYNVITTGLIDAVLHETTVNEKGETVPFPKEGISGVMPGMSIAKNVWVENKGTSGMYVRVRVDRQITPKELDAKYISFVGLNMQDWTLDGDYYYYNTVLEEGEVTEPLFEGVRFATEMPNQYQNSKVDVIVHVEAVQSKNNGSNVFEAKGWPFAN